MRTNPSTGVLEHYYEELGNSQARPAHGAGPAQEARPVAREPGDPRNRALMLPKGLARTPAPRPSGSETA